MNSPRWKSLAVIYLLGVLVMYSSVCWKTRRLVAAGLPDFAIYYCAGAVVRQGMGHQLYDASARFPVQQQFATNVPQFRGPLPWTHPPFEALFFAPFSFFSYLTGYLLWDAFNLILVGFALWLISPYLPQLRARAPALWLLAIAFFPTFFNLLEGQDGIVLLLLYAIAYVFLKKDRDAGAGAVLAVGLFKFHLILPFVLLLLLQKRWKVLYGFVPASIVAVLTSIAIAGARSLWAYPRYVFYWENLLASTDRVPAGMPNLRGLMYVFLPDWKYGPAVVLFLSLAIFVFTARLCRSTRSPKMFDLNFSLALLTTVLVSYHVVSYDLSVLLIPILLLANRLLEENSVRRGTGFVIACGIALLFLSPLQLLLSLQYKEFALMGFALLFWMYGIAGETLLHSQN